MELDTGLDNQASVDQTDTSQNQSEIPQSATDSTTQETEYKPFATGKEKFKVYGKEEEWDWNTTKKYAQLGKSAYQKLEEAAKIQKPHLLLKA